MINKLKALFKKPESVISENIKSTSETTENNSKNITESKPATQKSQPRQRKKKEKSTQTLSAKEQATLAGEPYVAIVSVDVNFDNISNGSFTLDWNDKFVINLIKSGYKAKETDTDIQIVDRWFTQVCRNIALEFYEQEAADPSKRELDDVRQIRKKDIGNGRSEIS